MRGAAVRMLELWFGCGLQRTCGGSRWAWVRRRAAIPLTVKQGIESPWSEAKVERLGSEEERDSSCDSS